MIEIEGNKIFEQRKINDGTRGGHAHTATGMELIARRELKIRGY